MNACGPLRDRLLILTTADRDATNERYWRGRRRDFQLHLFNGESGYGLLTRGGSVSRPISPAFIKHFSNIYINVFSLPLLLPCPYSPPLLRWVTKQPLTTNRKQGDRKLPCAKRAFRRNSWSSPSLRRTAAVLVRVPPDGSTQPLPPLQGRAGRGLPSITTHGRGGMGATYAR